MDDRKKVVIADDHPLVRTGLRYVLEQSGRYDVVGESSTGEGVFPIIDEQKPDLLLLDLCMPVQWQDGYISPEIEKGGFALSKESIQQFYGGAIVLATARRRYPDLSIVVITQYDDADIIAAVIRAGAKGLLLKVDLSEHVVKTLDRVMVGETMHSDRVSELLRQAEQRSGVEITSREKEVLQLIANGFRDRDIAERLDISLRTVAFHKANLKEKIGAETLAEVIAYYFGRMS